MSEQSPQDLAETLPQTQVPSWQLVASQATPGSNIIVNYLPSSIDDDQFYSLFKPYGNVLHHKIVRDLQLDRSLGYGFIQYSTNDEALNAINSMHNYEIEGKRLKVSPARPHNPDIRRSNLYFTGIPLHWTPEDVKNTFEPYGDLIECRLLIHPRTGMFRGAGFVRLDSHNSAIAAINGLNGRHFPSASAPFFVKLADNPSIHHTRRQLAQLTRQDIHKYSNNNNNNTSNNHHNYNDLDDYRDVLSAPESSTQSSSPNDDQGNITSSGSSSSSSSSDSTNVHPNSTFLTVDPHMQQQHQPQPLRHQQYIQQRRHSRPPQSHNNRNPIYTSYTHDLTMMPGSNGANMMSSPSQHYNPQPPQSHYIQSNNNRNNHYSSTPPSTPTSSYHHHHQQGHGGNGHHHHHTATPTTANTRHNHDIHPRKSSNRPQLNPGAITIVHHHHGAMPGHIPTPAAATTTTSTTTRFQHTNSGNNNNVPSPLTDDSPHHAHNTRPSSNTTQSTTVAGNKTGAASVRATSSPPSPEITSMKHGLVPPVVTRHSSSSSSSSVSPPSPSSYRTESTRQHTINMIPPQSHHHHQSHHRHHHHHHGQPQPQQHQQPPTLSNTTIPHPLQIISPVSLSQYPSSSSLYPSSCPLPNDQSTCLFIAHLPPDATDHTLYQLFAPYATVVSTRVIRDPNTGASRGFGFVNVASYVEGQNAIRHLNNMRLGHKHIKVDFKSHADRNNNNMANIQQQQHQQQTQQQPQQQQSPPPPSHHVQYTHQAPPPQYIQPNPEYIHHQQPQPQQPQQYHHAMQQQQPQQPQQHVQYNQYPLQQQQQQQSLSQHSHQPPSPSQHHRALYQMALAQTSTPVVSVAPSTVPVGPLVVPNQIVHIAPSQQQQPQHVLAPSSVVHRQQQPQQYAVPNHHHHHHANAAALPQPQPQYRHQTGGNVSLGHSVISLPASVPTAVPGASDIQTM